MRLKAALSTVWNPMLCVRINRGYSASGVDDPIPPTYAFKGHKVGYMAPVLRFTAAV